MRPTKLPFSSAKPGKLSSVWCSQQRDDQCVYDDAAERDLFQISRKMQAGKHNKKVAQLILHSQHSLF